MARSYTKTILRWLSLVFVSVGVIHIARLFGGWDLTIGCWDAPLWLSAVVVILTWSLALISYQEMSRLK